MKIIPLVFNAYFTFITNVYLQTFAATRSSLNTSFRVPISPILQTYGLGMYI